MRLSRRRRRDRTERAALRKAGIQISGLTVEWSAKAYSGASAGGPSHEISLSVADLAPGGTAPSV